MANIPYSGTTGGTASWPIFRASPVRVYQGTGDREIVESQTVVSIPPNRKERRKREAERRKGLRR